MIQVFKHFFVATVIRLHRIPVIALTVFVALTTVAVAENKWIDPTIAASHLTLAEDGRADATIVLADGATTAGRETANILADHLKQISGAEFAVVRENELKEAAVVDQRINVKDTSETGNFILLGESKLTASLGATAEGLGPGGILMRTFPNALVLLGPTNSTPTDQYGTRYAVTTFLEESLGCRFLWPGELGKVVPNRKTIQVEPINIRYTPVIRQRRIRMASGYGDRKAVGVRKLGFEEGDYLRFNSEAMQTISRDGGWARWHRMGGSLRLASGHSFGYIWEKHKDDHPGWFAVQPDGTRDQSRSPDRARLCVSNVELIEEIARERIKRLNRSDNKSVSIGPNDGGQTSFCRCADCRKLDPPNSRKLENGGLALTDRYVWFWNEIAERVTKAHPTATLTADAYSVYSAPPVLRKLHPNIAIRVVGLTYTDDARRRQALDDWEAWAKAVDRVYVRPNVLLAGRRQGTPVIYVHKMADDFRFMVENALIGTDFDSCCHNWATQGLNYYVCAKLHWNPRLDVDELIDDYCLAGFGSGADAIKKYFLRIEGLTNLMAASDQKYTEPYTPEVIDELRSYLDEAAVAIKSSGTRKEFRPSLSPSASHEIPAASATQTELDRVAFLRSGLDYTEAYVSAFHIIRNHQSSGGGRLPSETKQRIRDALDKNWLVSRDVFENNHLAVNVATVAWGSWNFFGRYGWAEPSAEIREQAIGQ